MRKLIGITSDRLYYLNHKEKRKIQTADFYRESRKHILDLLGNKCLRCGFDDYRALQIDHVNGGGVREKKTITRMFNVLVRESILRGENKYQLLCANCNWIKRFENGEVKKVSSDSLWR